MVDRDKVIKGLEHCTPYVVNCKGCPYKSHPSKIGCNCKLMRDALELLKEKEDVKDEM